MVRTLNVPLDDKTFDRLSKLKGKRSWRELMELLSRVGLNTQRRD